MSGVKKSWWPSLWLLLLSEIWRNWRPLPIWFPERPFGRHCEDINRHSPLPKKSDTSLKCQALKCRLVSVFAKLTQQTKRNIKNSSNNNNNNNNNSLKGWPNCFSSQTFVWQSFPPKWNITNLSRSDQGLEPSNFRPWGFSDGKKNGRPFGLYLGWFSGLFCWDLFVFEQLILGVYVSQQEK